MTNIHLALELSQLDQLVEFAKRHNKLAKRYENVLENLPVKQQILYEKTYSARHLYIIRTKKRQHRKLFEKLQNEFIGVHLHYMPVHLQPYYLDLGFQEGYSPDTEASGKEAISLPLCPSMTVKQQNRVIHISVKELR